MRNGAQPFVENIRKIDAGEEPYDIPPDDYNPEDGEPPFITEWHLNKDGLTLLGHSGVARLQVSLKLYLDTFKEEVELFHGKQRWPPAYARGSRDSNWFALYKDVFLNMLDIDWDEHGKENVEVLEQIALARDDIFHRPVIWTVNSRQTEQHFAKYTESFFADERFLEHYRETGRIIPGDTWAIDVPPLRMIEAIDRVDSFCKFMGGKWMSWLDGE